MSANWDHTTDLLVVGSGAGAMTTALVAHDRGARVLVLEKSDRYGGSTAMSGGAVWVPQNPCMSEAGLQDSAEEASTYLRQVVGQAVSEERLQAYIAEAPEMVRYLLDNSQVAFEALSKYPDYYPELTGGKPGGRSMESIPFSARRLGRELATLRPSHPQELVMGRVGLTAGEAHVIVTGGLRGVFMMAKLMLKYALDFKARRAGRRDHRLVLGNALIGRLRASLMDRDVPLWLKAGAEDLIVEGGRVVGAAVRRDGQLIRVRADKGVVLAAGGFARNQAMRSTHQRAPITESWSAANPHNTGDAIRMGTALGAAVDLMHEAWWTPTTKIPGKDYAWILVVEKSMPHSIMVNQAGRRFTNEAAPYVDVVNGMYDANSAAAPSIPAWLIFDGRFRKNYPCGPLPPGRFQPDERLPRKYREQFMHRAPTLEALAERIGVNPAGLQDTVERFNENARRGVDPDFKRGDSAYDRYYSDPKVKPNPNLGPLETAPYYAIEVFPGDLGTKGGLVTDPSARVLTESGATIPGLWAIGNCSASVMGVSYPGAGGTIGPAMAFGYVAARDAIPQ